jgi:hypothetical protein
MGTQLFDQYILLHFAVGIIVYFWGIDLWTWIIVHTVFELIENTPMGMSFINHYLTTWPAGKDFPDTPLNSFGDIIAGSVGWLIARFVDHLGDRYQWFPLQRSSQ